MAQLIIRRNHKFFDQNGNYTIYLDGKKLDKISDNEIMEFDIPSGKHQIYAEIQFLKSNPVDFEIKNEQDKIFLEMENNVSVLKYFLWLLSIFTISNFGSHYLVEQLHAPKYYFILFYLIIAIITAILLSQIFFIKEKYIKIFKPEKQLQEI